MIDQFGRSIRYMRISVTDRCNLRCQYCMPTDVAAVCHEEVLRYEEIERICAAAVRLGIVRFKITGGEPLVRKGCAGLIAHIKAIPGVEQVTLTTNGVLLGAQLDALCEAGLDAVNISLDTLDDELCARITGSRAITPAQILALLEACCAKGLRTKLNAVLLEETLPEAVSLAEISQRLPVDVRFIELMPVGFGSSMKRVAPDLVLERLQARWPDLHPTDEIRGNGPAHYYAAEGLQGRIGFIDAVSHKFCASCNRVRLTSTGLLKPCLCFDSGTDLRALLHGGCTDEQLTEALRAAVYVKPRAHRFDEQTEITERRLMSQIGG